MGVVVENKSSYCHQLMTCAADGSLLFWDTRPTKSAHQSQLTSVNKPVVLTVSNPLKQLDLTWKPILKVSVSHITGSGEFGPTKFSLAERHGDRSSIKQPDNDKEAGNLNRTVSMTGKKDQGKVLENIATMLFVGTESGDVVYMDWKLSKDSDSGKFTVSKPELVLAAHEGLVCVLQRSPFFKDILLSIGGWTFAIWKEGVSTGPLLESASFPVRLTAGAWSPTRPGVFFVTRADGNVDVWDLLDKSHEPSLTQNVTSALITSVNPYQVSSKQQLLSIGDNVGTLHIMEVPWNLRRPSVNEKNIIENFFEREVSRLKFVEERRKIRAKETVNNKENEKPKEKAQVDTKKLIDEQESEWEAKARQVR
ncbi:WD repeat-containing 63-like [Paramuricea clavata]|uniref:WD repeat-containing 63-like n=1 Tax=Paramuricea clavata TaxID=317549 RepID=A0A6S7IIG4_PARCT|nr:WD repeat-containing 63-like [Paramuricea clavata]